MQTLMMIGSGIGFFTVCFFAIKLIFHIVDGITFKRRLRIARKNGRLNWLPEYKQKELESNM